MAVHAFPFDFEPDGTTPQETTEGHFRLLLGAAAASGVVAGRGEDLEVYITSGGDAAIRPGFAVVSGYGVEVDDDENFGVPLNTSSQARIDRGVLRLDRSARTITAHVVEGTPASSPQLPSLTRSDTVWDLPLARWIRQPSGGQISSLTDERVYAAASGAMSSHSARRPTHVEEGTLLWLHDDQRLLVCRQGGASPLWDTVASTGYPTSWQSINLTSPWSNYSEAGPTPAWRWLAPGRVELRGTAEHSSTGAPMGSIVGRLPSAARPTSFRYQVIAVGLRNGHVTSRLGVASTGTTVYQPGELVLFTNSSSQRPTWLSLDGYVYDVS